MMWGKASVSRHFLRVPGKRGSQGAVMADLDPTYMFGMPTLAGRQQPR